MSLILSRLPRLLHHIPAQHVNCVVLCLRSKELTARGFSNSSGPDWTILHGEEETAFIGDDPRFSLPGNLGRSRDVKLNYNTMKMDDLVDFTNKKADRLHIKIEVLPYLLRFDAVAMFSAYFGPEGPPTTITLSYNHFCDEELGQKYLYAASSWISEILSDDGFPTNFINPFTGKPNIDYASLKRSGKKVRYAGLPKNNFKVTNISNECVYIKKPKSSKIATIFTSAPKSYVLSAIRFSH